MKSFFDKYFFLLVILVQTVVWCIVKNDPFFGDAIASTSRAANHIYANDLDTIFYPTDADPGHPTFYSYVLAIVWKICGRTLWVSHLYSCVWALFLALMFRSVAKLFMERRKVNIATILLLLFPTYLSQSAMMLNTVALMSFFLLAVYGLLNDRKRWLFLGSCLMCITHLQAAFLLLSLCSLDVYGNVWVLKKYPLLQWIKNRFLIYTIPFLLFAGWLFIHYRHTGWLLVSPQYGDVEELNGFSSYIKALLLMAWRMIDYGMLPFYIILGGIFITRKESRSNIIQWLVLVLLCCIGMAVFLENTIGHRYFMAFGMLAIILTMRALQYIAETKRNMIYVVLGLSLLAGNFLVYPGKNLGDATLAYRGYFTIEKQLKRDFDSSYRFYGHAPIANASQLMHLDNTGLKVDRINETPFDSLPVIVQSNMNAEFTAEQKHYLADHWYGKSYEAGAVYVNVFLNPKFYNAPTEWKLREQSEAEKQMEKLKQLLKN
jgi:hypothetical protein